MPAKPRLSQAEYEQALAASVTRPRAPWAADTVEFDSRSRTVVLRFTGGVGLSIPVASITELAGLEAATLKNVSLSPSGEALCLDAADVHISTRGLINAVFAQLPNEAAASRMGSVGGGRTSAAKKLSSAENGKKGGRPRKTPGAHAAGEIA